MDTEERNNPMRSGQWREETASRPIFEGNPNMDPQPERDDSFYENSYGSGSDSSRSMLFEGNAMALDNDREGREQDEAWELAQKENREWERRHR